MSYPINKTKNLNYSYGSINNQKVQYEYDVFITESIGNSFKEKNIDFNDWSINETEKTDIKLIEEFLSKTIKKYDIISFKSVDDPLGDMLKVFVLKVPENISFNEKKEITSKITKECVNYAKNKGILDTFIDTAIIVRR